MKLISSLTYICLISSNKMQQNHEEYDLATLLCLRLVCTHTIGHHILFLRWLDMSVWSSFSSSSVPRMPRFRSILSLRLVLPWTSVTLSTHIVMFILFLSTVMVSGATNMNLDGPTVFDNNSVKGRLAMLADPVICAGGLSKKMRCPRWNC